MQLYNLLQTSAWKTVWGIALAIAILLAMITVHEFGHYIAGKILKFRINEFAVGFGPALFKRRSKKSGVTFSVRIIPLGGFCAFDGEDDFGEEKQKPFEEYQEAQEKASEYPEPIGAKFTEQKPWKRIIVLLAGATMNYILALVCILLMFITVGQPAYRVQIEYPPTELNPESVSHLIVTDNPLKTGDVLLEIDGRNLYMFSDYMDALDGKKKGDKVLVTVYREGEEIEVNLILADDCAVQSLSDTVAVLKAMGVYGLYNEPVSRGFFDTVGGTFSYSFRLAGTILRSLGELITGKAGLESVGGPVTTIAQTSQIASSSLQNFFTITALIGVNLAVFNLLPIPALDGSKIVFCLIEWIRKKPVNRKVETIIHLVGILFLFGFTILIDILHLF